MNRVKAFVLVHASHEERNNEFVFEGSESFSLHFDGSIQAAFTAFSDRLFIWRLGIVRQTCRKNFYNHFSRFFSQDTKLLSDTHK